QKQSSSLWERTLHASMAQGTTWFRAQGWVWSSLFETLLPRQGSIRGNGTNTTSKRRKKDSEVRRLSMTIVSKRLPKYFAETSPFTVTAIGLTRLSCC